MNSARAVWHSSGFTPPTGGVISTLQRCPTRRVATERRRGWRLSVPNERRKQGGDCHGNLATFELPSKSIVAMSTADADGEPVYSVSGPRKCLSIRRTQRIVGHTSYVRARGLAKWYVELATGPLDAIARKVMAVCCAAQFSWKPGCCVGP